MCVFPKRCEQPVLCAGSLLANVLNWPWETVHPQMLGSYIHNGCYTCFCLYVCFHTHMQACLGESAHTRAAGAPVCVCSWWLCARQTAFICININTCLSCSPSHSCPLGAKCPRVAIIILFRLSVNVENRKMGTLTRSNSQAKHLLRGGEGKGVWTTHLFRLQLFMICIHL